MIRSRRLFAGLWALAPILCSGPPALAQPVSRPASELYLDVKRDFGAVGDGIADDSPAFQAALDRAAVVQRAVWAPVGRYNLLTTLNCTNRFSCKIIGETTGFGWGVILVGNTGPGKPVLDLFGASGFLLQDIFIQGGTSTIGVVMGYTSAPLGNNGGAFHRVEMNFPNAKTANSNLGTVGIYNKSGENVTYEGLIIYANLPLILTSITTSAWVRGTLASTFVLSSQFATLAPMSCGVHIFHDSILVALGQHRPALVVQGSNSINLGNTYLSSRATGTDDGVYSVGMQMHDGTNVAAQAMMIEGVKTPIEAHLWSGADVSFITTDVSGTNGPAVMLYGAGGGILNVKLSMTMAAPTRRAMDIDPGDPYTGAVKAIEVRTDGQGAGYTLPSLGLIPLINSATFVSPADELHYSKNMVRGSYYHGSITVPAGGVVPAVAIFAITPYSTAARMSGSVRVNLHVIIESSVAGNNATLSWHGSTDFTFAATAAGVMTVNTPTAFYNTQLTQDTPASLAVASVTPSVQVVAANVILFKVAMQINGAAKVNYTLAAVADVVVHGPVVMSGQ